MLEAVQRLKPVAAEAGLTMPQLAIAWVLQNPNVSAALVGASRPEQIASNVAASGVKLDADTMAAIDDGARRRGRARPREDLRGLAEDPPLARPDVPVHSAGLLLYRLTPDPEVLIAHMGGPFWSAKDEAAWSIPKGEYDPDAEAELDAALREFREELGVEPPPGPYAGLGVFPYSSGKRITVFVADGAGFDPPTRRVRRVRAGVAAAVGPDAVLPRGRPGGVDVAGRRARRSS